MIKLPTPAALASIVDETTQAMYGVAMQFAGSRIDAAPISTQTAPTVIVPLIGDPLLIITAHVGPAGAALLASAVFNCEPQDVNDEMVEDSLRELCNIVATQVKNLIAPDHEIGLPSRLNDVDTLKDVQQWSAATLHLGPSKAEVAIAVAEFAGLG